MIRASAARGSLLPMGDSACWLQKTCFSCGRVLSPAERRLPTCPYCDAELLDPSPDTVSGDGRGEDSEH